MEQSTECTQGGQTSLDVPIVSTPDERRKKPRLASERARERERERERGFTFRTHISRTRWITGPGLGLGLGFFSLSS